MAAIHESVSEMQNDHKHWLKELERWSNYVETWQQQQRHMLAEIDRLREMVERHGRAVDAHGQAIETYRSQIADCERLIVERQESGAPSAELAERHATELRERENLLDTHEALKKSHHTLLAGMAIIKQEPFREE